MAPIGLRAVESGGQYVGAPHTHAHSCPRDTTRLAPKYLFRHRCRPSGYWRRNCLLCITPRLVAGSARNPAKTWQRQVTRSHRYPNAERVRGEA